MRRALLFIALATALTTSAQQPPSRERGFKPELMYQFGDFDNIALFNGNLTASVPLGPTYPVGAGLSYSFVLRYSGNLWREIQDCRFQYTEHQGEKDPCYDLKFGEQEDAGMGWRLSFGELRAPVASAVEGTALSMWSYKSPDGAEHLFYSTLHDPVCSSTVTSNCDPATTDVFYTRDGTYLRMKKSASSAVVEFPNGERHRFEPYSEGWWLRYMYTTFSALDPTTGVPNDTAPFVRIDYVGDTWEIHDTHGRQHVVRFQAASPQYIVDSIELEAFRGGGGVRVPATYDLSYTTVASLQKPCVDSMTPQSVANVSLLTGVALPSGEDYTFTYDIGPYADTDCSAKEKSGTLISARLPTYGKVKWTYQPYQYNGTAPPALGIATRTVEAGGVDIQRTDYNIVLGATTIIANARVGNGWAPDSKTVHYHRYLFSNATDFALPYTMDQTDGRGHYLSSQTFDCDPATVCSSTPLRETYVKYEWDAVTACNGDNPCGKDRNRRVVSESTVYNDDTNRHADVNYSGFDGLGHYRSSSTDGNFASGNVRTSYVGYNAGVGTYTVINESRGNGFTMLASSAPWVLGTYDASYQQEGANTVNTEACFDGTTGFLRGMRRKVGSLAGASDLITLLTADSSGYLASEEFVGGDKNVVPTTSLCTLVPVRDQYTFRIDHTYEWGAEKTARSMNQGISPPQALPFFSVNNVIDRGTGLVYQSLDPSGLITTYHFDTAGRLDSVTPAGTTPTTYAYTAATATSNSKVVAETGSGADRIAAQYEFDPVGRVTREGKLMPDGTWSHRETLYDSVGRRGSVSEPGANAPSTMKTIFSGYDPFGRPASVTAPGNRVTTFTYTGVRLTTRTEKIATAEGVETDVSTSEENDRAGRLVKVSENSGGASPVDTSYEYDTASHLKKVTMSDGSVTQTRLFTYDDRGLLVSEQHPESGATQYEYDARGHIRKQTTPVATLTFEYDPAERLTRILQNGASLKEFAFDGSQAHGIGRLDYALRHNYHSSLSGGDVVVKEKYFYDDPAGRLTSKQTSIIEMTGPPAGTVKQTFTDSYAYDTRGQLISLQYPSCDQCGTLSAPSRTVTNAYANGLLIGVDHYAGSITYHPNGMLSTIRHLNGDASQTSGPLYRQTLDNGAPRPGTITVEDFCNDLSISQQPQSTTVPAGTPVTLTVTASGATSYEWYESPSGALAGSSASLNVTPTTQKTYWARVKNGNCFIDSERATITISGCTAPDATISALPTIAAGGNGAASVPQTGGATYSWSITNGTITSGGGTSSITYHAACSGSVILSVTVTTSCSSASSSKSIPVFQSSITVSGSQTIAPNTSATITASLTGTAPWTVRWSDGTQVTTSSSPISRVVTPSASTTYTADILSDGNGCFGTSSGSAVITVGVAGACTITGPDNDTVPAGGLATFSVPSPAAATPYWEYNFAEGTAFVSGDGYSMTFRANCAADVKVRVTVSGVCGPSPWKTATRIVPVASLQSGTETIAPGGSATLSVTLVGTAPWTVTWSDNVQSTFNTSPGIRTVSPTVTTTYQVSSMTDGNGCAGTTSGSKIVNVSTAPPPAPQTLVATGVSSGQVNVTWTFSGTADSFELYRNGVLINTGTALSYTDTSVQPSAGYWYKVNAVKSGVRSADSNRDVATTQMFANDPIIPGQTAVAALHITQLRTAVNSLRAAAGLSAAPFPETVAPGVSIAAIHITQLRSALDEARSVLQVPPVVYERPSIATGNAIRSRDVTDLRGGVK